MSSFLLMIIQSLKFFSHFGVRALLVLYLIHALHVDSLSALALQSVFFALIELSIVIGGVMADKVLGLKRASQIGCIFLSLGFVGLIFSSLLFESLSLIVLGSSLFSGNIIALFGQTLSDDEVIKKKSFTSFYIFQNVGAAVSVLVCSYLQQQFGFQIAFAVSSLGMVIASFLIVGATKSLPSKEKRLDQKKPSVVILFCLLVLIGSFLILHSPLVVLPALPFFLLGLILLSLARLIFSKEFSIQNVVVFISYLSALILFYATEEQMFSSLLLFTEKEVDKTFFGISMPAAFMMAINPLVIIFLGNFQGRKKSRHYLPFVLVAISFAILSVLCALKIPVHLSMMAGVITLISLAEVMLGPLIYSFTSSLGKENGAGELMGILSLGFCSAYTLGGVASQGIAKLEMSMHLLGYSIGFGLIAAVALIGGITLELMVKKREKVAKLVRDSL